MLGKSLSNLSHRTGSTGSANHAQGQRAPEFYEEPLLIQTLSAEPYETRLKLASSEGHAYEIRWMSEGKLLSFLEKHLVYPKSMLE